MSTINLIKLFIDIVIMISSLYSAWTNFVKKKISNNGFDSLLLVFFSKSKAAVIRRSPQLIKRMGIIMLLVGLGAMNEIISILRESIH